MTADIIEANFSYYSMKHVDAEKIEGLMKYLSVWDGRYYRFIPIGYHYNEETQELRIPRGFSYGMLKKILDRNVVINNKPQSFKKMSIDLLTAPRDKAQLKVISFLCGLGKYSYTSKFSQVFSDMVTGKGKTYCTVASIAHYKMRSAIFIPASLSGKLIPQWIQAFTEFTNKRERDILVVQGSKTCEEILSGDHDDKEIYIFSKSTVLSFAKKHGWEKFTELMEKTQVGIKVIDEAHMDLRTNVMIDCHVNVKRNIYLTASVGRGDRFEDKIFKSVFQNIPVLGKELVPTTENYINMIMYHFFHKPSTRQRAACKTREGLSAVKYSAYLVDPDGARNQFFTALNTALRGVVIPNRSNMLNSDDTSVVGGYNRNVKGYIQLVRKPVVMGKLLILGSTREFLTTIQRFLQKNFPELTIGMYTSDVNKNVRDLELERDIILATEKGLGTGADIPHLQFMINLIPYSNKILANQLPGRVRQIKGKTLFYMELINVEFPDAAEQYNRRLPYLAEKAKSGKIVQVEVRI